VTFKRYAVFYAPCEQTDWVRYATRWLGWDMERGVEVAHPASVQLPVHEITKAPRKYGLHATLKPPFGLKGGASRSDLERACTNLAARLGPVSMGALKLIRMGRFLALCPECPDADLNELAAACVRDLDQFRAAASAAEIQRRRSQGLNAAQEHNLTTWGYPHVMEAFRFHITVTGRLPKQQLPEVEAVLNAQLTPLLPKSLVITDIALVGEADDGRFHVLDRFPLSA
jgi:putative phosphonate metabolism protein